MAYITFNDVENEVKLIRSALSKRLWFKPELDIDVDLPNENPNGVAIKDVGGAYQLYISTNISGDWKWELVSSDSSGGTGTTNTIIVETKVELDNITNVDDGTLGIVREENRIYYFNTKDNLNEWEYLGIEEESQNYLIVESILDRDNLTNIDVGVLVYVTSINTEYRWDGNEWIVSIYQMNETETTGDEVWYISPDGSDVTGDGTELNPWETLQKCLVTIPRFRKHKTNIYLLAGSSEDYTYTFTPEINELIGKMHIYKAFIFFGDMGVVDDTRRATGAAKLNNPMALKLDDDDEFDNDNQYLGYYFKDGSNYYPISAHKKDEVVFSQISAGIIKMRDGIHKAKTKIVFEELLPSSVQPGGAYINYKYLRLHINRGDQNGYGKSQFQQSILTLDQNKSLSTNGFLLRLNNLLIISNNTNAPVLKIDLDSDSNLRMGYTMIVNTNPSLSRAPAIQLSNSIETIKNTLIEGFAYGIRSNHNTIFGDMYGSHYTVVNNCGALIQLFGSGFQWNSGSDNPNRSPGLFLNDVNYLFAINAGTDVKVKNINVNFGDGYLQNELNIIQPFVTSSSRVWGGGNNLSNVNLSLPPKNLIDFERNINIVFPNSFGNIENSEYLVENNNEIKILIGKVSLNRSIKIEYNATSMSDIEIGSLYITNKNELGEDSEELNLLYRETVFDDIGLVFKKSIENVDDIFLTIENTRDDEEPITLEMDIRRYQI